MTVQNNPRCLVEGQGYGTILDEKRGWLLIQFDDNTEAKWVHENNVTFDETPGYEDYQHII